MGLIIRIQADGDAEDIRQKGEQLKRAIGEVIRGFTGQNVQVDLIVRNSDALTNRIRGFLEDQK